MWQLERMAPAQKRGERIDLDESRTLHRIGRASDSDVRLYSAAASRAHAELQRDADGLWWIAPLPDCVVLADGEPVNGRCELCEGLSLEFGHDRFRCQTPVAPVPPASGGPRRARTPAWLLGPAITMGSISLFVLALVWLRSCG